MLRKGVNNSRSKLSLSVMKKDKSKNSTYILVNQVTNGVYLQEPDWAGNIELADRVNHDHYRTTVAKDAAKALRIKLISRQPREQFLALSALECLMKNCGPDFHEMMLSKGVLETCMELGSNTTTNHIVRDKVLHLIREWSEHLNMREFKGVYRELTRYGVRFPERDEFVHPGGGGGRGGGRATRDTKYDDISNVDVTGDRMIGMNGGEPLHYPAAPPSQPSLGIPRHSQSVPVKQVLKYDAAMSEEDRRAIEMALREEEEAVGGGGGMAYDGGRDGALGMTRAQRNELPGGGHWSSKRYQRSIGNPNKYKLDGIGRKPEGLMPVEGKFVNRTISLTKAQEHPDRIRARERKASDVVESAQSILCVFEETLSAPDKDDDLCGILAEQAKESSSSLVALLTEEDGDMDEALTSKLIELSGKLNVAIQKYERIGNDRAPQTSSSPATTTTHQQQQQQRQVQHDLLGLSSDGGGFNETTISSPNPFLTNAPSSVPSVRSAATSDEAFDEIFGNSFSPHSPPQQSSRPMSLREQYMLKQQQQQQQQQNPNNNNNSHNNSNSNSRRRSSKDVRVSHPKHTPPHRGTVGETYSADVLFSYPPSPKARIEGDDEDSNTEDETVQQSFDVESIAHFCFPSGVEPKLVEKTASMSKILEVAYGNAQKTHDTSSFVFRLTGGESGEEPLYGVCLYANEFVSQMPVIASSSLSSALSPNSSFSEETIPSGGDGEGGGEEANLRKYLVAAPRCYCFITKTPFFKTTFEVLRAVVTSEKVERLRRDERRLMKDLEMAFSRSGITPTKPPPPPLPKTSGDDEESKNIARDLNFSEEAPRTLKNKTDSDVKATSSRGFNRSVEDQTRKNDDSLRILESFHAESIPKLGDATRVFNGPLIKDEAEKALNSEKKKSILDAPILFYRPVSTTDDPCFERKCIRDSVGKITYTYDEEAAHIEPWAIAALCRSLSIENIMAFMACALLEKQVVVFSPNLGQLSGVILSLLAMLRPLRPRGLFLPILPNSMTDFLEAPVPFIVGIQHKTNDIRQRTQHITRLNAYKDEIKIMGGIVATAPNWHELREKLRPIHASIRLAAETQVFSSVLEPSEKSSKLCGEFGECFRNHMRDAILGRIRSYSIAEVGKDGQKVAVLLKDELVDSYVGRDRSFMKNFCETQLFTAFTDELLDN